MILHDSAEFKRILHIAKFFAMLGSCFETTKIFQKKRKKQGLFRLMATQVPNSKRTDVSHFLFKFFNFFFAYSFPCAAAFSHQYLA